MNASLSSITTPLIRFLGKYHATLFFTFIILLLAGAILSLYLTISTADSTAAEAEVVINSNFDQKTAEQIQTLRDSNQSTTDLAYPSTRSNPFVE